MFPRTFLTQKEEIRFFNDVPMLKKRNNNRKQHVGDRNLREREWEN